MKLPSVLMISDSERESRVGRLVRHVERELRHGGASVNVVLPGAPVEYPSHAAAVSDAVVVVARERNQSFSGVIKTLLDSVDTSSVVGKPFGLICYSDSEPVATVVDHLRVVVSAMQGVPVPGEVRMSLAALTHGAAETDAVSGDAAESITSLVGQLLQHCRPAGDERHPQHAPPRLAETAPDLGFDLAQPVQGKVYEGIALALSYIKENFSDQSLSLDTVANAVFMSRYHFSRKFRGETGRRFIDYLIMLRMTEARKLLIESNRTVTTIAADVGYRDLSNFERSFKKLFGMQPSQYRLRYARPTRLHDGPPPPTVMSEGALPCPDPVAPATAVTGMA